MSLNERLTHFGRQINGLERSVSIGRISAIDAGVVKAVGLTSCARIGDQVTILPFHRSRLEGEVVQIAGGQVSILVDGSISGTSLGDKVYLHGPISISPCDHWLGRILDSRCNPLDGQSLTNGTTERFLNSPAPSPIKRGDFGPRLATGTMVLNTVLPIVQGQRIGLFAGSGVGKSTLLAILAKSLECDVCVIGMVGERGREVGQFVRETLGEEGLKRSIVVAATSDQSSLQRRRSAWTATAVAEYFRDQGKSVLLLIDSITRFAEAHREIALAGGESPALRGFPASTPHLIAELCERSGPGEPNQGNITAIYSVLVAGSDMDEPVADILRGVLDGHIVLNRDIAERGRFPAIDVLRSVSRSMPQATNEHEAKIVFQIRKIISTYEQNVILVQSGLYTAGADTNLDTAMKVWPEIDHFFGQTGQFSPEQSFDKLNLILRRGGISVD